MNNYSKILLTLLAIGALVAVAPMSNAQNAATGFGTQVKNGDSDFVPTASAAISQVWKRRGSTPRGTGR